MIEPIQFNLNALAADFQEDAEFWMGGFYDHNGMTSNGVAYGDDVFSDTELGDSLWDSSKNQLGMDFEYNTEQIRLRITEGGYVEAHGSDDFETLSLVRLVNDLLLNYESEPTEE
ncbi:hypothetical protein AV929_01770 [Haloarcula sp. K1]|nr:hypothetical protein AV929_01770 [Haloarcula sp. K1]